MSKETDEQAARFSIEAGFDDETNLEVASVVRDDGLHLNLNLVDALIEMGQLHPAAFESLTDLVFDLTDDLSEARVMN